MVRLFPHFDYSHHFVMQILNPNPDAMSKMITENASEEFLHSLSNYCALQVGWLFNFHYYPVYVACSEHNKHVMVHTEVYKLTVPFDYVTMKIFLEYVYGIVIVISHFAGYVLYQDSDLSCAFPFN